MRILITDVPNAQPVEFRRMQSVILAATDGAADGSSPVFARGEKPELMHLASVVLVSVRQKLGSAAFEAVVRHARSAQPSASDITDQVRSPRDAASRPSTEQDQNNV